MSKKAFLKKLALERAQYHLAQLCAVVSVSACAEDSAGPDGSHQMEGKAQCDWQAARLLIENLGRDLAYIDTVTDLD